MQRLIYTFSLAAALALVGFQPSALAEIIGADDFSEADGTTVNGKFADIGGSWSAPGAQTIVGGVLDTDQVGQHQGSFLNLTRALGAGEVLTMTFTSAESLGSMFNTDLNGYAGMSFFINGDEKLFVGDPGGGQALNGWALDGFSGGTIAYTGVSNEAVTGTFTYNFDTGLGTLQVTDGISSGSATRNYTPGHAINRFRIQSGSSDPSSLAISAFSISAGAAVPEPTSIGLLVGAVVGCALVARKRAK